MRHEEDNGAWLCVECHRQVHRDGLEQFRVWLLVPSVYDRLHAMAEG